jgi:hypothetical protein
VADSLVISNTVELLGGGVASTVPACAGARFRLAPGYDLSAPQPTTDFVASLILDGSRPFGRRADNRLLKLPVVITAPDRITLAGAREVLEYLIDADRWTLTWTRDPGAGTPLPLLIDCFRAQATTPAYNLLAEKQLVHAVLLTVPALPYGRSDVQVQVPFAAPVPASPPAPPAPVVLDTFSTVSSPQHYQSNRCVVGPFSLAWDPDDAVRVGDPGGRVTPFVYSAQLAVTANLAGLTSLQMYLGFGSRYYTYLEYHGQAHGVQVTVTLTDSSGNTLSMGKTGLRLPVSPTHTSPTFSRVTMPIPQGQAGFNYQAVTGYSITIINRQQPRRLSWLTAYIDNLAAYPPSVTASPVTRGSVFTLHGVQGTARSPVSMQFIQPPTPGTPTTITAAGVGNYTVPAATAWLKVEAVGGGGAGATQTGAGFGGGGSGAEYTREDVFPAQAGQVIPYSVGAGGQPGAAPVDGQATVFGPGPSGSLSLIANGGLSAAQNSTAGPAGGTGSPNAVRHPGGAGRTASGQVGGGGGGSGGSAADGLAPTGTAAALFITPGTPTWTCPAGVTQVYAEVWGSGGSGASGSGSGNGGGGGGGEYAAGFVAVTPGNVYNLVVAAGGAGVGVTGTNGNPGASSSFTGDAGAVVLAHGGGPGLFRTGSGGRGAGGTGSGAAAHFNGGQGGDASPYSGSGGSGAGTGAAGNAGSGYGGTTWPPSGGGPGGSSSGASSSPGTAGSQPGGGGGGTYSSATSGAGAAGQVKLTYPGGAPTNNGAAAVTGGGAGGNGGGTPGTAGSAGQQPGGGGGGADSSGTTVAGGAGGAGRLVITPYTSAPFKCLIAHRPPLGAPRTFQPLVSVGGGADTPNGATEYTLPQPVAGVNADFNGTYTCYLVNSSWSGGSGSGTLRTITVTVKQYEFPGGPSYSTSTVPISIAPNQVLNGLVTAGVLTLPLKAVAADNMTGYYTVTVTDSQTADRFTDCIFLDTMGQTLVSNLAAGYVTYWSDGPNPDVDLGYLLGSQTDRSAAISVVTGDTVLTGGPLHVEPAEGDNQLFVFSADALAPNVALAYYPAWYFDRIT